MRLAILTSHPIQYQVPLFRALAQSDIDVRVLFCWNFGVEKTYDPEFGKEIKWDIPLLEGYKFTFLKNYSPRPSSAVWWGIINFGIIKELWRKKYDAILIYGWNRPTHWFAIFAALFFRTPIFLHSENPLRQEQYRSILKQKVKKMALSHLFRSANALLYIGKENKKFYESYGVPESKLFFCPYAVDNERFVIAKKELGIKNYELRKKLGIKRNAVVILFVGKLIEKKRPFDLLKAHELLNSKPYILNSSLIFAGDGALCPQLEKYAREHNLKNVIFVGFKNQTELPKYYALADIFVLPSGVGETWGLVVNEAMCFNLPVIVSDIVGCGSDLVKKGENGYIFPLGNIEKLAGYLEELILNGDKRKKFGEKSFGIIQNYSHKKDIEGILKALSYQKQ